MQEVSEAEIISKNKHPRITLVQLLENITKKEFVHLSDSLLTICILTLKNGFQVTGESACAVPENYDQDMGERLAYTNAEKKIWALMGYELKSKVALLNGSNPASAAGMKTYVGTKVVHATPMNRQDYNFFRGWELPADENGADEGYLVEYADSNSTPNVRGYNGYISWSPSKVFEASYEDLTGAVKAAPDFLGRMVIEFEELLAKQRSLKKFIREQLFQSLSLAEQDCLVRQEKIMHQYLGVLDDRIQIEKKKRSEK